jgi:hypothetical protein
MSLVRRLHTSATPAEVWALVGTPDRWPTIHPALRRMQGAPDRARTGQTLLAIARVTSMRVPVDVVDAVPERRLELLVRTAPGLSERLVLELAPSLKGGCELRGRAATEGLFGRLAAVPSRLSSALLVRLVAVQAERTARAGRRSRRGAA